MDSNLADYILKKKGGEGGIKKKKKQNIKPKPIKNPNTNKKTIHPSFVQNSSLQINPSLSQMLIYNVSLQ